MTIIIDRRLLFQSILVMCVHQCAVLKCLHFNANHSLLAIRYHSLAFCYVLAANNDSDIYKISIIGVQVLKMIISVLILHLKHVVFSVGLFLSLLLHFLFLLPCYFLFYTQINYEYFSWLLSMVTMRYLHTRVSSVIINAVLNVQTTDYDFGSNKVLRCANNDYIKSKPFA